MRYALGRVSLEQLLDDRPLEDRMEDREVARDGGGGVLREPLGRVPRDVGGANRAELHRTEEAVQAGGDDVVLSDRRRPPALAGVRLFFPAPRCLAELDRL